MKRTEKHGWFAIILAMVLVIQMSFQTFHVLSSHTSESHIIEDGFHSKIHETTIDCDLCAKLLGQPFLLLALVIIALAWVDFQESFSFQSQLLAKPLGQMSSLRGPPSHFP